MTMACAPLSPLKAGATRLAQVSLFGVHEPGLGQDLLDDHLALEAEGRDGKGAERGPGSVPNSPARARKPARGRCELQESATRPRRGQLTRGSAMTAGAAAALLRPRTPPRSYTRGIQRGPRSRPDKDTGGGVTPAVIHKPLVRMAYDTLPPPETTIPLSATH